MSSSINDKERKIYEKDFIDFLTERINHAGGSLQFQYLSGVLQQLKFEVKEAFGTSNCQLMKFLKSHTNNFKVDRKGIVTVVNSSSVEKNVNDNEKLVGDNSSLKPAKHFLPKIENGEGWVIKLEPEFGIIKSKKPVSTYVYFTPLNYDKLSNRESLFIDQDLEINSYVCFNAVYVHEDYEIQYRASKVWKKPDANEYPEPFQKNSKYVEKETDKDRSKNLKTQGKSSEAMKSSEKSHNVSKQSSEYNRSLDKSQIPSHSVTTVKDATKKSVLFLKNQKGRIYPSENGGAFIKFGKGDSELVDGNSSSCEYFLYGSKVQKSDINYEFSKGGDVFFDCMKFKNAPDWTAILVWVGEKPADKDRSKKMIDKSDENEDKSYISEADTSINPHSLPKYKAVKPKNEHYSTEHIRKKIAATFVCSANKECKNKSNVKSNHNNLDHFKNVRRTASPSLKPKSKINDSRKKLWGKKYKGANEESSSSSDSETVRSPKEIKKLLKSKRISSEDDASRFSQERDSDETDEIIPISTTNIVKTKASIKAFENIEGRITDLYCKAAILDSPCLQGKIDFMISSFYLNGKSMEEQMVIDLKEILKVGDTVMFNCFVIIDDEGETHKKTTIVWKGTKPMNVEEMSPEDFIEGNRLKVSVTEDDAVESEFSQEQNYFSLVVSDSTHNSSQTKSLENDVSDLNDISSYESDVTEDNLSKDVHDTEVHIETEDVSNTTEDMHSATEHLNYSPENDVLKYCEKSLRKLNKNDSISHRMLSEKIIQKLKDSGFISVAHEMDTIINEVSLVLEKHSIKDATSNQQVPIKSSYLTDSPDGLCTACSKKTLTIRRVNVGVQTIITGEIVATSIYPQV